MAEKRPRWAMGGITYERVENYLYELLPASEPVLAEMEQEAAARDIPIVGPAVGRLLFLLAQISGARRIFEMGSAIGYSTIWWARALSPEGRVIYTDGDPKNADQAGRYFERARVADRIQVCVGDALELLSEQAAGSLDIVFCDVDKEDYPRVFKLALPHLKSGGLLVADNVLWSGRVAQPNPNDKTRAIQEFNRLLFSSPEVTATIIPLRDGVSVARKL